MGRSWTTRALGAAAVLTASAVLLAGCGSLRDAWGGGTGSTRAATEPSPAAPSPSGWWSPAGTPTPTPTPTQSETPSPSPSLTPTLTLPTPAPSATATPTTAPSPTTTPAPAPSPSTKPRTSLVRGDSGPKVLALQKRLSELGYWLGTPDGAFGSLTQQAVWALQKSAGLERDGVVGPRTSKALAAGIRPRATLSGNGVEIDLRRQVVLVVRGGTVRTILHTSTGSGEEYTSTSGNHAIATTPRGRFTVYRAVDGEVTNSLGTLWRPRFFNRGIAVHGSQNIPPWPDSHGCARLSNAAIDMIWARDLMPVGSRVVVR